MSIKNFTFFDKLSDLLFKNKNKDKDKEQNTTSTNSNVMPITEPTSKPVAEPPLETNAIIPINDDINCDVDPNDSDLEPIVKYSPNFCFECVAQVINLAEHEKQVHLMSNMLFKNNLHNYTPVVYISNSDNNFSNICNKCGMHVTNIDVHMMTKHQ